MPNIDVSPYSSVRAITGQIVSSYDLSTLAKNYKQYEYFPISRMPQRHGPDIHPPLFLSKSKLARIRSYLPNPICHTYYILASHTLLAAVSKESLSSLSKNIPYIFVTTVVTNRGRARIYDL